MHLVRKPIPFCDRQTRRVKRKSEVSKNQLLRQSYEPASRIA